MAKPRAYEGNGHSVTIADPDCITREECVALAFCGSTAWNSWRNEFRVGYKDKEPTNIANFSEYDFKNSDIDFENYQLGDCANFKEARFPFGAKFLNAHFGMFSSFQGAELGDYSSFSGARFSGKVDFIGAQFGYHTTFFKANFEELAEFGGAQFEKCCDFTSVIFKSAVSFESMSWEQIRKSVRPTVVDRLIKSANERGISPTDFQDIDFSGAQFFGSVSFENRSFLSSLSFRSRCEERTLFSDAPIFHGCTFSQDTTFDSTIFPEPKGDHRALRAYRTLKLACSQLQSVREEQRFFKLEMEEEAALETNWRRWLFRLYRELSDFGFSIGRPVILFFVVAALAAFIYGWQAGLVLDSASTHTAALVQFSLASAIPGLEKLAEPAALSLFGEVSKGIANYSLPTVLTLLAHKAISLLALFLIGLALRNLFKMK